jgi:hypothetical protein
VEFDPAGIAVLIEIGRDLPKLYRHKPSPFGRVGAHNITGSGSPSMNHKFHM